MSVATCLCSNREENIYNYSNFVTHSHLSDQLLLNAKKNITSTDFPNNSKMLEDAESLHISLHPKYSAMPKKATPKNQSKRLMRE